MFDCTSFKVPPPPPTTVGESANLVVFPAKADVSQKNRKHSQSHHMASPLLRPTTVYKFKNIEIVHLCTHSTTTTASV